MKRWLLFRSLLNKEIRVWKRDPQQLFALVLYVFILGGMAWGMENRPAKLQQLNGLPMSGLDPKWLLLAGVGFISFMLSFLAIPQALGSFVGEKEERTLELFLAAPIPDATLYVAKFLSVLVPSLLLNYAFLSAGSAYALLFHGDRLLSLGAEVLLMTGVAAVLLPVLLTGIQVGLAVCISVWAHSKKGAEQLFGAVLLALFAFSGLIGALLSSFVSRLTLIQWGLWWTSHSYPAQIGMILGALAIPTLVLMVMGQLSFRRERLVL